MRRRIRDTKNTSSAIVWIHSVQCHYDARKSVNCPKSVDWRQ